MINRQRIADEFARLAAINGAPLREAAVARYLHERLEQLGATIQYDNAAVVTGGEVGNMVAKFAASNSSKEPILFSAHMDTVEPGGQVEPKLVDGVFYSAGDTILGADDKAGIAEIIEAIEVVREQGIAHGPIEVVLTIAEEIGLVGAKHFNYELISARRAYALDTPGVDWMVLQAPAANRLHIEVTGRESHAGVAPEKGLSAILAAALAIEQMRLGRVDYETTANIGRIEGGVACNIVPRSVRLEGEARSHDHDKLRAQTEHMLDCFNRAAASLSCEIDGERAQPKVVFEVQPDYPRMAVSEDAPVVTLAMSAAAAIGHDLKIRVGGGGSDANMFNAHGIETVILGTGMQQVHSTDEHVAVDDMVHVSELLVEIIRQA